MSADTSKSPVNWYRRNEYERAVSNSALWAAAGDALGWMTELTSGTSGVKNRIGSTFATEPVDWKRRIGGRLGVTVNFPGGSYSDDTQLRLCVSRSIRGSGLFDVEAFAKIEVTAWQGYALGAGLGSKAAASNLSKRGVNWFSNFFVSGQQKYTSGGGNGAAMRIQPHVWSSRGSLDKTIQNVLRDSIVTHGHPHGFCGAVFHALCLWFTLSNKKIPPLKAASQFVAYMDRIPQLVANDYELETFWRSNWEKQSEQGFSESIRKFQSDAQLDISIVEEAFKESKRPDYHDLLKRLNCLNDTYRGSGFKTALAAFVLAQLYSAEKIEDALIASANELESDTDTIATMAGALLGAISDVAPRWKLQDKEYIESEARRMCKIALNEPAKSFSYPDVSIWNPPGNQSDAVVNFDDQLALAGVGELEPISEEYKNGTSIWQWFKLPFGQTILAKRRAKIKVTVTEKQMPTESITSSTDVAQTSQQEQNRFDFAPQRGDQTIVKGNTPSHDSKKQKFSSIDSAADKIIASNYDDELIGKMINQCIDTTGNIEAVVALTAVIARARLAKSR
ncbi:ADP-ribosylglycohydrolase family protein [Alteromonas sp. BL110]|uniref:ADP-ribosylglycohydrolase family protein n=1 Tax=Alteromonas sp. BL110 TaxID=1714845 RepID=UPI0019679048|nr:ADP-ribosylglycohydrolase family protein [Alteromonas sp. BL110]